MLLERSRTQSGHASILLSNIHQRLSKRAIEHFVLSLHWSVLSDRSFYELAANWVQKFQIPTFTRQFLNRSSIQSVIIITKEILLKFCAHCISQKKHCFGGRPMLIKNQIEVGNIRSEKKCLYKFLVTVVGSS